MPSRKGSRRDASAKLIGRFAALPGRACSLVSTSVSTSGLVLISLTISLVALFLLHQLTLWSALDPELAFHRAKLLVVIYSTVFNTVYVVWNASVDVLLVAIPAWNAAAAYVVTPLVFTALDILSIAFTKRPYGGVISDDDVPYNGFDCPVDGSLDQSAAWCGLLSRYSADLGVASGSTSSFIKNSTIVLSTQTARRLSEATGDSIVGTLDLKPLLDAIQALLSAAIVLVASLSDVVFHVVFTVLSEVFEILFNTFILLVKTLSGVVVMVVRSGLLQSVIRLGLDLLVVVVVDIVIPYFLAMLNLFLCLLDYFAVSGWVAQLACIQRVCFQESSDLPAEIFNTFTSVPPIARTVQTVISKLLNRVTGQSYTSSSSDQLDVPEVEAGSAATPRANACADCFTCKVPEMRAIFLLVGTIYGCALDGERYAGRVEAACLQNGTGYVDLCGPRGLATELLADREWAATYTMHRQFKDTLAQHYAGKFQQLSEEQGGAGNEGYVAHQIADSWFNRDVGLGLDQSALFVRRVCREMHKATAEDGGPDHNLYPAGSMPQLSMAFAYETCKHAVGLQTCSVDIGQRAVDFGYEVASCMKSQPSCLRHRQVCLGRCNGEGVLAQDFATTFVKQELSVASLGSRTLARARANCTVESRIVEVPLFYTGERFERFSARLKVRGGFNAINPAACRREPLACAAIQKVRRPVNRRLNLHARHTHTQPRTRARLPPAGA